MRIPSSLSSIWRTGALLATLAAGAAAQSEVPAGSWLHKPAPAGWAVARGKAYEVQSEVGAARAERLLELLEGLRPHFEGLWPARPRREPLVVKVFASRAAREAWMAARALLPEHAPPPGAAEPCALLEPFTREVLACETGRFLDEIGAPDPVRLTDDALLTLPRAESQEMLPLLEQVTAAWTRDLARDVLRAAWFQHLAAASLGRASLPAWLDEGLADWLAAATPGGAPWRSRRTAGDDPPPDPAPPGAAAPDPASGQPDTALRPGALHEDRLRDLLRADAERLLLAPSDLLARHNADRQAEAPSHLVQGWGLVHFLMTSPDESRRALLPTLLAVQRDGLHADPLQGLDLRRLDADWRTWLRAQRAVDPLAELARRFRRSLKPRDLVAPQAVREAFAFHLAHPQADR